MLAAASSGPAPEAATELGSLGVREGAVGNPFGVTPGVISPQWLRVWARHYLTCMSLVTDLTPPTALATLTAPLISARELTKPLN